MKPALALLAVFLLGASPLRAADDDRIVPAHEEPRHVPRLVNHWVRVIDVEIPEGERTLFHAHALDYPYLMITSVTLKNQIHGQEPRDLPITRGLVGYYRASTQGTYTHRFINLGPGTFRAVGIELLRPLALGGAVTAPMPSRPGLATALDNERVRAYRITLEPGQSLGPLSVAGPSLRVAMTPGLVSEQVEGASAVESSLAPAQFAFSESGRVFTLTNRGDQPVELVEFEFK